MNKCKFCDSIKTRGIQDENKEYFFICKDHQTSYIAGLHSGMTALRNTMKEYVAKGKDINQFLESPRWID